MVDTDTPVVGTAEQFSQVAVIDLPADMPAADMARLMEDHSQERYLLAVIPWPGMGGRAFFRKHALAIRKDMQDSGSLAPAKSRFANPDGRDEDAEALIRKYPKMQPARLADKLAQHGIVRSGKWVYNHRKAMERASVAAAVKGQG